jgi:predicted RNase H-like nuclease
MVSLGIDVSVARGLDLILLDEQRRLVCPPLRRQMTDGLIHVLTDQRPDIVAIDSPPKPGIKGGSRLGERELLRLRVHCYFTPSDPRKSKNKFYDWMRVGFSVFAAAKRAGYPLFATGGKIRGSAIEVFPHGSAVALKGCLPPVGTCRSGGRKRRWRAAVLEAHGVDTRALRSVDGVDAALAALTGLMALEGKYWVVGDATEGVIVLPGCAPGEPFPKNECREVAALLEAGAGEGKSSGATSSTPWCRSTRSMR